MTVQSEPEQDPALGNRPLLFPEFRRIRSGLDFERIYGLKQKASDGRLVIFAAKNDLGHTRIGLSVSRRHGNSVKRHRMRRLLREGYRLAQYDIAEGLDLVLIPGRESSTASQAEIQHSLVRLSCKLAVRLNIGVPESNSPSQ